MRQRVRVKLDFTMDLDVGPKHKKGTLPAKLPNIGTTFICLGLRAIGIPDGTVVDNVYRTIGAVEAVGERRKKKGERA